MSLTRKMLKAMSIEEEKIEQIIDAHSETVDALKLEIKEYKDKAEQLSEVQKQLDEANQLIADENKESYKTQFESIKNEFENFKNEQAMKELRASKETAYAELLKESGVIEKSIPSILKASNHVIDELEIDENGKLVNSDDVKQTILNEWDGFIEQNAIIGASVERPPVNNGGNEMTKEKIMSIKDNGERVRAIAQNKQLFEQKGD